jgi:hypothetical protein
MQNSLSRSSPERDLALMQQEDVRAEDKGRVEDNLRWRECMSKWFDPNTRSLPASAFRCVSADSCRRLIDCLFLLVIPVTWFLPPDKPLNIPILTDFRPVSILQYLIPLPLPPPLAHYFFELAYVDLTLHYCFRKGPRPLIDLQQLQVHLHIWGDE